MLQTPTIHQVPVIGFGKRPSDAPKRYSSDPKIRAAELVSEGRFGGKQPGAGRPRKSVSESQQNGPRPASEAVAAAAREHAAEIAGTFVSVLQDPDASQRQKNTAAKSLVGIEAKEVGLQLEEQRQGTAPARDVPEDRDQMISQLAALLIEKPLVAQRLAGLLASAAPPPDVPPNLG